MVDKETLNEVGLVVIISFFLFFVSTNVNPQLGNIYQGLAILGVVMLLADKSFGRKDIKLINKSINWATSLFIALISYVILILSSYFLTSLSNHVPLPQILSLLNASAPVFASSSSINFLIFAVAIPIIETMVIFALAIDLFASIFNIPLDRISIKLLVLFIVISTAFLLFHVNAKGITNTSALLLVGVMAFISCWLIYYYREYRTALLLHILANTIASFPTLTSFVTQCSGALSGLRQFFKFLKPIPFMKKEAKELLLESWGIKNKLEQINRKKRLLKEGLPTN